MKRTFFTILVTLLCLSSYAQIVFEPGYIVDTNGIRKSCLIKNVDWKNNPKDIKYKLTETSEPITGTLNEIKEFGIDGGAKYLRFIGKIDRSSEQLEHLSRTRHPEFKTDTLFLKPIIEGKATLYFYEENNLLQRFFYRTDSMEVEQLVYKTYLSSKDYVEENNQYLQQLLNSFHNTVNSKEILHSKYCQKDLVKLFEKYNGHFGAPNAVIVKQRSRKDWLNLTVRLGLTNSSLTVNNEVMPLNDFKFKSKQGIRFGAEMEIVLPFNKNKFSFIVEPTYLRYKSDAQSTTYSFNITYNAIEIPFGVRYYSFLNNNSKIFINACIVLNMANKSTMKYNTSTINISPMHNFALGVGYKYGKRLSSEIRYNYGRQLFTDYKYWTSNYKSISFIVGYTL